MDLEPLKKTIYKTIPNIELWKDVLHEISELTGISKGIITLRNRATADIFIPADVKYALKSPLLYGFSHEALESYITHYVKYDLWTEVEKLYHPSFPYALSKYVSNTTLRNSPFWEWLEPQGIEDTIVLDIGSSSNSWVAMNLYYSGKDVGTKELAMSLVKELQPIMIDAWEQGLRHRMSKHAPESLYYFLEQQLQPSFVIDSKHKILLENTKAIDLLDSKCGLFKDVNGYFRIEGIELKNKLKKAMGEFKYLRSNETEEIIVSDDKFTIKIILLEKAENIIGEDKGLRLISIERNVQKKLPNILPVWENSKLTKRERQLVEIVATGGRVVDFHIKYGIAKSTGHLHWSNVKKKLNIKDRSEIYAIHQLFIKTCN